MLISLDFSGGWGYHKVSHRRRLELSAAKSTLPEGRGTSMRYRPRRKKQPLFVYLLLLLVVASVAVRHTAFSGGNLPKESSVVNSELTYSYGPVTPVPQDERVSAESDASGGPPSIIPRENENLPNTDNTHPQPPEKAQPAQFKDAGFFAGGKADDGIAITGIRFGKDKDIRRVVIDFGAIDQGGKIVPAEVHPRYRVEYRACPYRFTVTFPSVKYADTAKVQKKYGMPFSLVTDKSGRIAQLEFFITSPAMFKVIEVDDPARLAIDIKFRHDAEVPKVHVVQVVGVETVERAFELVDLNRFPASFKPQVVVIGDRFFIEGIYDTFEKAVQVNSELENSGYSTIISERKGNAFPVDG